MWQRPQKVFHYLQQERLPIIVLCFLLLSKWKAHRADNEAKGGEIKWKSNRHPVRGERLRPGFSDFGEVLVIIHSKWATLSTDQTQTVSISKESSESVTYLHQREPTKSAASEQQRRRDAWEKRQKKRDRKDRKRGGRKKRERKQNISITLNCHNRQAWLMKC